MLVHLVTILVTMVTNVSRHSAPEGVGDDGSWPMARAKARLSEVVERALTEGPQIITRNGRRAVVVVAADEWERKSRRQGTLAEFLASSPLAGSGLNVERLPDGPRETAL
jgi:prevent-host-death family protein